MKKLEKFSAKLTAALMASLLTASVSLAAETSSAFKLTAVKQHSVSDNPSLVRDAAVMKAPPYASMKSNLDDINSLEPLASAQGAMPIKPPHAQTQPLPAAPGPSANRPHSYLDEYDVDWSGWISHVGSRWFQNLRFLESSANMRFITDRPALIQFTCYANGQIGNFSLRQSSGVDVYDRLQMLALSQVTPLPPFPAGTQCSTITLVQGWESHVKRPGERGFDPISFGRGFPVEKVRQWVRGL